MNKKIVSLAIAAALAAPMAASADATVYGKLNQTVDKVDSEVGTTEVDEWQINNRASRLGVKGSEDLGNGLKAVYKVEFQLGFDGDEFTNGAGIANARNVFAGVAGGFGTVVLGAHDTPLKMSTGALDYFADSAADNNDTWTEALADRRASNTIAYISPSFSGLTVAGAIVPGEDSDGENAPDTEANGLTDAYSLALMYSNAGIYASVAREFASSDTTALAATGEDLVQTRIGLGYSQATFGVNLVHETVVIDNVTDNTSIVLAGKFNFGNSHVAAKYFNVKRDESAADDDTTGYALKVGHNLSKRTSVSAIYLSSDMDDAGDNSTLSFGLTHNF